MTATSQNEWNQELLPLVIYHANCADGFSAAWCFHHHAKLTGAQCSFYPGVYQKDPPNCTGRDVYMVDFSYKPEVLKRILKVANSVTIIDHHKSAVEAIMGDQELSELIGLTSANFLGAEDTPFYFIYDMNKSGATLAWDYLFGEDDKYATKRPLLLGHIEDRDLWKFKLAGTREISANVFSYEYTFENWDKLMAADQTELLQITAAGAAIERKHHKDIKEFLSANTYHMAIAGYIVPAANLPYFYSSDAAHAMAKAYQNGEIFAACYWDTPTGRTFSLRSCDNGMDVSVIAARYGGGGHKHAAGFSISLDSIHVDLLGAGKNARK